MEPNEDETIKKKRFQVKLNKTLEGCNGRLVIIEDANGWIGKMIKQCEALGMYGETIME